MQPALHARAMPIDFEKAADFWEDAQKFIAQEFLK
jgi:hypothetical protein